MTDKVRPRSQLRAAWRVHKLVWRASGGRLGRKADGMKFLELVTTGSKSGEPRSVLLSYRDGPTGPVVVGSNAGAKKDPAWVTNLRADTKASILLDSEPQEVKARFLEGEERSNAFDEFKDAYDGYRIYDNVTERAIAVIALEPI